MIRAVTFMLGLAALWSVVQSGRSAEHPGTLRLLAESLSKQAACDSLLRVLRGSEPHRRAPATSCLQAVIESRAALVTQVLAIDLDGRLVVSGLPYDPTAFGRDQTWREARDGGRGSIAVGAVRFDPSTQSYRQSVAITLTDPNSDQVLGVLCFVLDPEQIPQAQVELIPPRPMPRPASDHRRHQR
jgi:hypothetical protein